MKDPKYHQIADIINKKLYGQINENSVAAAAADVECCFDHGLDAIFSCKKEAKR